MNAIHSKAMLAGINISVWSARALDRKATVKVNDDNHAKGEVARVNKSLVSKAALAEITEHANKARRAFYARTLPWADSGNRILSALAHPDFMADMRTIKNDFDAAVSKFIAGYPDFVAQAQLDMNGLFNADDYPAPEDIATRFGFRHRIWPMPNAADFRVEIGDAELARVRAEIGADFADAINDAVKDVYSRIADVVGDMAKKLTAFAPDKEGKARGTFRDSLVENVRELVKILPSLNITGDAALAAIAVKMESLCFHSADDLRDDPDLRKEIADKAVEITTAVSEYLA